MKMKQMKILLVVWSLLFLALSVQADVIYSSCDRWATFTQGDWKIYNNVWGNKQTNTQCLYVNSINSWYVDSIQSGGGVKSYPNTSVIPNTPLAQMQSATCTYNTSSAPGVSGDWWNWTTDIWSTNGDDEIMIFTSWYPQAGGWGTKIMTNVTIGGIFYAEVWQADPGWNVIQFIPAQQSNSGSLNCLAVWQWCASQGLLTNTTFAQMQFGIEITSTNGQWKTYSLNNYEAEWSNTSGGGSSIGGGGGSAPTAPSSLAASAVSSSQINLAWSDNSSNESNFELQRATNSSFSSGLVTATLGSNVTTASATGLAASTTYYFRVRATNSYGASAYSNTASATTPSSGGSGPAAPSNLTASAVSTSQINLAWSDNSSDESGFRIDRALNSTFTSSLVTTTVGANVTSFQATGLAKNTRYYFRVRAYNANGESANSNTVNARTKSR